MCYTTRPQSLSLFYISTLTLPSLVINFTTSSDVLARWLIPGKGGPCVRASLAPLSSPPAVKGLHIAVRWASLSSSYLGLTEFWTHALSTDPQYEATHNSLFRSHSYSSLQRVSLGSTKSYFPTILLCFLIWSSPTTCRHHLSCSLVVCPSHTKKLQLFFDMNR